MADQPLFSEALEAELDEVLSLLPLVEAVPDLADRVFTRLTDALVEALLEDLRARHRDGELDRQAYLAEMRSTVVALEARGLLRRSGDIDDQD
ncbi:hypothetical protein BH24ACT4_BH24ACT4_24700 [soil metagenome]